MELAFKYALSVDVCFPSHVDFSTSLCRRIEANLSPSEAPPGGNCVSFSFMQYGLDRCRVGGRLVIVCDLAEI